MSRVKSKTNNKHVISSDNISSTLYSRISEIQPLDLLQRLDKEGISTRGDMPGLRAKLLRHELRKIYPEANAALYKDLELNGNEADNWCTMMHLWEIDARARIKMREQQEHSCLIVDKKLDDLMGTRKPFKNDITEKNRVDYLMNCVKLLKSWELEYPSAKCQVAKEFLEDLKDFRKFAELCDQVLLSMLPSVLKYEVKAWYRSKAFTSWEEFETAFVQHVVIPNQPRAPSMFTNEVLRQRVPYSATTTSATVVPQVSTHSVSSGVRPSVETRMAQNFAFGNSDVLAGREQHKLQKVDQEQPRPQLLNFPTRTTIRQNSEEERYRLREHQLHRAQRIEYLQQAQSNCTKEQLQAHHNVRATSEINQKRATVDKSTEMKSLSLQSNRMECAKNLRLWNVKYSGENGQAVVEFIDDLNNFRKYANVSDDALLDVLPCVLSGSAKRWFHISSLFNKKWSTWEEFIEEFLKRFYDPLAVKDTMTNIINSFISRKIALV